MRYFFEKYITKNVIAYIFVVIFSIIFLYYGNQLVAKDLKILSKSENATPTNTVKVTKVVSSEKMQSHLGGPNSAMQQITLVLEGNIIEGPQKGRTITFTQNLEMVSGVNKREAKVGDRLIVYQMEDTSSASGTMWVAGDHVRSNVFIWLVVIFMVLLIIFGKWQGVNTIVSLVFTCLSVFLVFVPSILSGYNIYFTSILTCLYIIVMTLLIISGWNVKSLCASIGCFGGVLVSAIMTFFLSDILKISGLVDEDSLFVLLINPDKPIDLKAIIFAAVIIGALGAAMDVAMSISSSLHEICEKVNWEISLKEILSSGLTIGRDIMGTMANTLILAYIGSSLSVVLLLISYQNSLLELFNKEMIVTELMQSLIGSFGILFTIPITALICAFFYTKSTQTRVKRKRRAVQK